MEDQLIKKKNLNPIRSWRMETLVELSIYRKADSLLFIPGIIGGDIYI